MRPGREAGHAHIADEVALLDVRAHVQIAREP